MLAKRWTRKGCLFAAILKLIAMAPADHLDASLWIVLTRLSYTVSLVQLQAAVMELSRIGLLTCECCRAGRSLCLSKIRITAEGRAALVWFRVDE